MLSATIIADSSATCTGISVLPQPLIHIFISHPSITLVLKIAHYFSLLNHFGNTHDLIYTHIRGWYVVDALHQFGGGLVRSTEDLRKFKKSEPGSADTGRG